MPTSLQYPLERHRDLQRKWGRLLQQTSGLVRAPVNVQINRSGSVLPVTPDPVGLLVDTMPHECLRETPR